MSPLFMILIGAFGVVLVLTLGVYWLLVIRPESQNQAQLKKRLKVDEIYTTEDGVGRLEKASKEQENPFDRAAKRAGKLSSGIEQLIKQADIKLSAANFYLLSAGAAFVVYLLVWALARMHVLALGAALFAAFIPLFFVRHKRSQRIWKFEEQFPEAIDLISRALRAGHAFTTSLAMVADEIPDPVGTEFRLLYDRQNYGMPMEEALRDFADRVPLLDARFFVTAVLMQRETGGNLAEVLDNLAAVIRERFKVKRQVRVLTAHGRITGWILAGFPPALALALFIITPDHLQMLIEDPLGVRMIVGAITLQIIGTFLIRKLVNIPY
jgi:tight adherence protein B